MREYKDIKIAIAGTGYVGLSLATLLAQNHDVIAVDVVPEKIDKINSGKSPIQDEYIEKYLKDGEIEQVICGGENYNGARVCNFDWVKNLRQECVKANITFCIMETGTVFMKDKKIYNLPSKELQSKMAFKSKMNYQGKEIIFKLYDQFGRLLDKEKLYKRSFKLKCNECASKLICNGCSECKQDCK